MVADPLELDELVADMLNDTAAVREALELEEAVADILVL